MYGYIKRTMRRTRKRVPKYAKRSYKAAKTVYRLAKDVAAIQTALNVERKYHDKVSLVTSTATATAPILLATPWDGLEQGPGTNQRIGDQVKALWTTFKVTVDWAPTGLTTSATTNVRFIAFIDTEVRAASISTATQYRDSILQVTSTGPLQITSPYKVLHTGSGGIVGQRYKIIKDFVMTFDNVKRKQQTVKFNFNHTRNKYRGMRVKYDESGSDFASDDRLVIIAVTDSATADDLVFSGDYSRMCYVDN